MNEFVYTHKVQYYETDQMKIVHHSNYIRWFEEARCAWMESVGLSYDKIEETGIIIPVLSVDCEYKKTVCFGQLVDIVLKVDSFNGIKVKFLYEIYDKDTNELCTIGNSEHCFLDENMQLMHLKKKYPDIYKKMQEAININCQNN